MKFINTEIKDLIIIKPKIFNDPRGYFMESYRNDLFKKKYPNIDFVQENESFSFKKVIRGMHYQEEPYSQSKIIRVLFGKIWDIVIDLRPDSPSYLSSFGVELSHENRKQLFIPSGFAHGFAVTSEFARVIYKANKPYMPHLERGISPFDPHFKLKWPFSKHDSILSDKDLSWPVFKYDEKQ